MGEFLTQDSYGGADALEDRDGEGGPNGKAVDEIVQPVTECDHPGQRADVRVRSAFQPIAATPT